LFEPSRTYIVFNAAASDSTDENSTGTSSFDEAKGEISEENNVKVDIAVQWLVIMVSANL